MIRRKFRFTLSHNNITGLKDESSEDVDGLPEPSEVATDTITELERLVDDFRKFISLLRKEEMAATAN